jgi:hypothetical protein
MGSGYNSFVTEREVRIPLGRVKWKLYIETDAGVRM